MVNTVGVQAVQRVKEVIFAAAVVPMLRAGAGGSDESAGGRGEDG